ncbi:821_t:CDS:10 [Ambispora gerdemannii]|uniref:821_t:CDS:1 n=1 Tax=Ambispora gerdemannii TaxID=144530 RepID=A0A9N9CFR1_9GLOM|nr:821_t:CDS:10 [Ambispora gerdemannii]
MATSPLRDGETPQPEQHQHQQVVVGPVSPKGGKSVNSFGNAMSAFNFTSLTSPQVGGARSYYSSSQSLPQSAHPSYSASPLNIRQQTLKLGDIGLGQENGQDSDDTGSKNSVGSHDPDLQKSNLSMLLQTTPEGEHSQKPHLISTIQEESESDSKKTNTNPTTKVTPPTPSDDVDPYTRRPHSYENKDDEHQPLLKNQMGLASNYGNDADGVEDDTLDEEVWEEKPWFSWLPCVNDWGYLPFYVEEELPSRKVHITPQLIFEQVILNPISYIPAVILGLLLNLLDAISYGMITFPIAQPIFSQFGPDGVSMFFVSTIISQLVYSLGGSIFGGGNGSMMIEVVPFLHIMAEIIIREVGENNPKSVIATTILSFALSTIVTGSVFLLLGALKLGSLIEFFPRHILVGCIGGVGWFLVATGIEVAAGLDGNLEYNLENLKLLFLNLHILSLWGSAFGLAVLLRYIHSRIHHSLVVPFFFMLVPLCFYSVVYIFGLKWEDLRNDHWVFPLPEDEAPWYRFYTYYDFKETNWGALVQTVPAMFALTFFGILHVPINIPALGVSVGEDNVNTNRELVAHGFSNILSGFAGSVQNYLVYTNSVLFIKTGGDSRVAGVMLAAGSAVILFVGPWIVGYIPVMVVGALIFHLGLDLLKEALIDTWGIVNKLEYITITVIVIAMAAFGFIEGIFLGIIMACVFFVVSNSRKTAIRATYSGSSVKSTVRRLYRQQKFLKHVGSQIFAIKLQGYMFFGTISGVENAIRRVLTQQEWRRNPIRFLIVDFFLVTGLDFSAAEAFIRIQRLLQTRDVYLVLCGVQGESEVGKALISVGMWWVVDGANEYLQTFENFNEALEWCENKLLKAYYVRRNAIPPPEPSPNELVVPHSPPKDIMDFASPRHKLVQVAGQLTLQDENSQAHSHTQPFALLVQTFQDISDKNDEFFHLLTPYFHEIRVPSGARLWKQGDAPDCLYLVERGLLRATFKAEVGDQAKPVESILPGTMAGELGFFADRPRDATLYADMDCILWQMRTSDYEKLLDKKPLVANEFMRLSLNFSAERLATMTHYAFHLA